MNVGCRILDIEYWVGVVGISYIKGGSRNE